MGLGQEQKPLLALWSGFHSSKLLLVGPPHLTFKLSPENSPSLALPSPSVLDQSLRLISVPSDIEASFRVVPLADTHQN